MKKRNVTILIWLMIAAVGFFGLWRYEEATFLDLHGHRVRRNMTTLDLSGRKDPDLAAVAQLKDLETLNLTDTDISTEDYKMLRSALPHCEITWEVPFQGRILSPEISELTLTSFTEEDLDLLAHFPNLKKIDATACEDLTQLMALRNRLPHCEILYHVTLEGRSYAGTTTLLSVESGDIAGLEAVIPCLPDLNKVIFTDCMPDEATALRLKQTYPEIVFTYDVSLFGRTYSSLVRGIDLSGIPMESVEEVESKLSLFYNLEKVIMCDCGISSEEMDALWKRHPETRFVWSVPIRFFSVRTDATTLMPYQYGCTTLNNADAKQLKYLVDMVCIDFGHMGINDLSFLEYMPNLQYLILVECDIADISPLANLKKLKYLELFMNRITDISPLAGCESLRDVNICFNPITDISPLYGIETLENIWASGLACPLEQVEKLHATFPSANILTRQTHSSTAYGWRQIPGYYEQRDLLGMWYTYPA